MSSGTIDLGIAPIQGYHHHAYILSIVASHPSFADWFYSNYIGLYCHEVLSDSNVPLNFWVDDEIVKDADSEKYTCALNRYFQSVPLATVERLSRSLMIEGVDIVDFCVNAVDKGRAVFLYLDKYFIPGTPFYAKHRRSHQILVYGYDKIAGVFNAMGYDDKGRYGQSVISFENFRVGYREAKSNGHRTFLYFLAQNPSVSYSLQTERIVREIQRYLEGAPPSTIEPGSARLVHGICVLDCVANSLRVANGGPVDLRPVHILWEHKRCFQDRFKLLNRRLGLHEEWLETGYKKVIDQTGAARMLVMKYRVTKNSADLRAAAAYLDQTKRLEIDILSQLTRILLTELNGLYATTN